MPFTHAEYSELEWSYEYDPPLDDLLRTLLQQIATLTAAFFNANSAKDAKAMTAADFLPTWGEQFSDEDDPTVTDEEYDVAQITTIQAAMTAFGARARDLPLMPGHGRPVPADIFALFTAAEDEMKPDE